MLKTIFEKYMFKVILEMIIKDYNGFVFQLYETCIMCIIKFVVSNLHRDDLAAYSVMKNRIATDLSLWSQNQMS